MPCRTIKLPDGTTAIACTRGRRGTCSVPGCGRPSERLCDYLLAPFEVGKEPKTCDAKLCSRCAVRVGPNKDYCPPHARSESAKGDQTK